MKLVITWADEHQDAFEVPESYTYREIKTMRQITGLEPAQFEDAVANGNADLAIALAVVSSARAGKQINPEQLYDLPFGAIMVEEEEGERPTEAAAGEAAEEQSRAAGGVQPS